MTAVPIEITSPSQRVDEKHLNEEDVEFLDNLDDLSSTEAMLGCGDDNPWQ